MSSTGQDTLQESIQDNDCAEEGEIVEDMELDLSYETVSLNSFKSLNSSQKSHNQSSNRLYSSVILTNKDGEDTDQYYKKSKRKKARHAKDNSSRIYKVDKLHDRNKKTILNHTKESNVISERRTSKSDKTPEVIFLSDDERPPASYISTRRGSPQEKENSVSHLSSKLLDDYIVPKPRCKHKKHAKQGAEHFDHSSSGSKRRDKIKPHKHKEHIVKDAVSGVHYSHSSSRPKSSSHRNKARDQYKSTTTCQRQTGPEIISVQNLNRFKDNTLMRKLLESGTIKQRTPPRSVSDLNCEVGSVSSVSSPEFSLFEDIHLNSEDLIESKESVKDGDEYKMNCTVSSDSEIEVIIPEKKQPELIELRSDSDSEHVVVVEGAENISANQVSQSEVSSSVKEVQTNAIGVQENDYHVDLASPLLLKEISIPDDVSQTENVASTSEHQPDVEQSNSGDKEDDEVLQLRVLALKSAVMKKHIGRLQKRALTQSAVVDDAENSTNRTHEQHNIELENSPSYSAYCPSDRTSPLSPTISSSGMSAKDDHIIEEQDMEIAATDDDENCIEEQNDVTSCLLPATSNIIEEFHVNFQCDNATSRLLDTDGHSLDTADSCNFNEISPQPLPPGVDISSLPPEFTHSVFIRPKNIYNSYVNEMCQQHLLPNAECDLSSVTVGVSSNDNKGVDDEDRDFFVSNGNSQRQAMAVCEQACDNTRTEYDNIVHNVEVNYKRAMDEEVAGDNSRNSKQNDIRNNKRQQPSHCENSNTQLEQILENASNVNNAVEETCSHFEPVTLNHENFNQSIKNTKCRIPDSEKHLSDNMEASNNNLVMNKMGVEIDESWSRNDSLGLKRPTQEEITASLDTDLDSKKTGNEVVHSLNVEGESGFPLLARKEDDEDEEILRAELLNSLDSIRTKSSATDTVPVQTAQLLNPIKMRSKLLAKRRNTRMRVLKQSLVPTSLSDSETSLFTTLNVPQVSYPEKSLKKVKKPLVSRRKVVSSNPVIGNCNKFIIKVGEDSDSGEDMLATPKKNSQIDQKLKTVVDTNIQPNNHERLTAGARFEKQVDLFLKEVREKHESHLANRDGKSTVPKESIKVLDTQSSIKIASASVQNKQDSLTPLAVRHLPKSQQEEYRKLKQQILEKERLKNQKLLLTQQAKLVPVKTTKTSVETSNKLLISQNRNVPDKGNESRSVPNKVNDTTEGNCSKCSEINVAQVLQKQESFKLLNNVETQLVSERHSVLESLADIDVLLNKMTFELERYNFAQSEVGRLKEQLKCAENNMENSIKSYMELKSNVGEKYKKLLEGRLNCSRYSKTCKEVGSQVVGSQYVLPKCLEAIMKNKTQEIAKKKDKYLIHLAHNRKRPPDNETTTNDKSTSTIVLPEFDNCVVNENTKRQLDDSSNNSVDDHQNKRLKQGPSLIKSDVNPEDTTRMTSSNYGNNVLDYISPLYLLSGDGCSRGIQNNRGKTNHDAILCPYDLKGSCLDDKCPYQH